MDEGRKRVLLIAASILAARKLAQYEAGTRVPATVSAIADAIHWGPSRSWRESIRGGRRSELTFRGGLQDGTLPHFRFQDETTTNRRS